MKFPSYNYLIKANEEKRKHLLKKAIILRIIDFNKLSNKEYKFKSFSKFYLSNDLSFFCIRQNFRVLELKKFFLRNSLLLKKICYWKIDKSVTLMKKLFLNKKEESRLTLKNIKFKVESYDEENRKLKEKDFALIEKCEIGKITYITGIME